MSAQIRVETGALAELRKIVAFFRRDLLVSFGYRLAFFSDWFNLAVQIIVFGLVGKLVPPSALPTFDGQEVSYVEFVAVGIAISSFVQLGMTRVTTAVRSEQVIGTLESILATPTALATVQVGWVVYDIVYVPLRTVLFLTAVWLFAGVDFDGSGILPSIAVLLAFIPFVWGFGVLSAAGTLTFRRGSGSGLIMTALTITSGAYFPLSVLPEWAQTLAEWNPIAVAVNALRECLLGSAGWPEARDAITVLVPAAAITLSLGIWAFRVALRRERRKGTVGLY